MFSHLGTTVGTSALHTDIGDLTSYMALAKPSERITLSWEIALDMN